MNNLFSGCALVRTAKSIFVLGCSVFCLATAASAAVLINEIFYHPESENSAEEFVELHNTGPNPIALEGWRLGNGVQFSFPPVTIAVGGYLVVAANLTVFNSRFPGVFGAVGNWSGKLSNRGEAIELMNPVGQVVDRVAYADEGDWAVREKGPLDFGHRGWRWRAAHDGAGASLELINPALPNELALNWAANRLTNATPGRPNSIQSSNTLPLLFQAGHFPILPRSTEEIRVTVRVADESMADLQVRLWWRRDGAANFEVQPMADDGLGGDLLLNDGIFSSLIPRQTNGTIVEFFLEAVDQAGQRQTLPRPAWIDEALGNFSNFLLQVDDTPYSDPDPIYRLVMKEMDRAELAWLGRSYFEAGSNAEMNGTFISSDAGGLKVRYQVGIRNRGNGSRAYQPNNYRIQFTHQNPWQGRSAINLNSRFPYLQLIGSALFERSGLPAFESWPAQVRVNSTNLAISAAPMFGFYVCNEVVNTDFAENHFPGDESGNIYRAIRLDAFGGANLRYQGDLPDPYRTNYFKESNDSEDNWNDLIGLTRALSPLTPESIYPSTVQSNANLRQWFRYLAVNTLIDNNETSLSNGDGDDYYLYRGVADPRFILLPHDLDTIIGQGDAAGLTNASLFRATMARFGGATVLDRLLKYPTLVPIYFEELRALSRGVFAPSHFNPFVDEVLGGRVPIVFRDRLKQFMAGRTDFILREIPETLSVTSSLPRIEGYFLASNGLGRLEGRADPIRTARVEVNGIPATWSRWEARWSAPEIPLNPGINRLLVESLTSKGVAFESIHADVYWPVESIQRLGGTLTNDTTWRAADGPFTVTNRLQVLPGTRLTIEAGVTVYFSPGAGLDVLGGLEASGRPGARIRLSHFPGINSGWGGIQFFSGSAPSRMAYLDMENASQGRVVLTLNGADLTLEHASWNSSNQTIIALNNSSLVVRDSVFPSITGAEAVVGYGMPPNGKVIFERNIFYPVLGGGDVIDFTGGQRPGPIFQALNNLFLGGNDDALDLDGTDAHIEGNIFQNFHQDIPRPSSCNGVATGGNGTNTSEVTVVRNLFFNNDHALLLKEGAVGRLENNTVAGSTIAAINFGEPERGALPGAGVILENNIFWDNAALFQNQFPANGVIAIEARFNNAPGLAANQGNVYLDPLFRNAAAGDYQLGDHSPLRGLGEFGADQGAFVPAGIQIIGVPESKSFSSSQRLYLTGPGQTHYRYRLNNGPWSEELPIEQPLELAGLTNGEYQVAALGKNSAEVWQEMPALSTIWQVATNEWRLSLNEVLARNIAAFSNGSSFPDLVEIRYQGSAPLDLGGVSLSDDPALPRKFTFPPGTMIAPEQLLILFADSASQLPGWHLNFSLRESGESVILTDAAFRGGSVLDAVYFGQQLADHSIARDRRGQWALSRPTPSALNETILLGDPGRLKISEWLAEDLIRDDFVELYNPVNQPVALGELFLTDRPGTERFRHDLAPLSFIAAGGYLALLADGNPSVGSNHLNFKLSAEQGTIALIAKDGALIDSVYYGPQLTGVSQGRGILAGFFPFQSILTPGAANAVLERDRDGDRMDDSWEFLHGLNYYSKMDGILDEDRDGLGNWQEFLAGTDPMDATSIFRVITGASGPSELFFQFHTLPGRRYQLQEIEDLAGRAWVERTNFTVSTEGELRFSLPMTYPGKFFRVRIE